jgi:phosphatidate cytidylyltransferase
MPAELVVQSSAAAGVVLGGSGLTIVVIETVRGRSLRSSLLATRWRTWSMLAVIWIAALTSAVARFAILSLLGAVMAFEYGRLGELDTLDRRIVALLPVGSLILLVSGVPLEVLLVLALLTISMIPVTGQDVVSGPDRIGKLLTGATVAVLPTVCLWEIGDRSLPVLVAVLFGVALSDVAAFTVGSAVGRRPLARRLSPNKTWEGAAGNLLGAVVGVGIAVVATDLDPSAVVILGPVLAFGAISGDLLESLLKRSAGVKDAGGLLPGFGGVLDRVDSLIAASPLTLMVLGLLGV